MANHFDEQDEPDDDLDIPGNEEDPTTATAEPPSMGGLPIPGTPAVGPTSYYPPLSPNARMVIGQEIPQSQWLRQPLQTQVPWSVLEYDRRKKEMESQERMDALVRSLARTPMASASKAIEMATQMEGRLAFDADVQSGVPIPEALMKHATKMYAGSPASQLGALKMAQQGRMPSFRPTLETIGGVPMVQTRLGQWQQARLPTPIPTGPIEATAIIDPETKEKIAAMVPGTKQVLREKAMEGLSPAQKAAVLTSQLRSTLRQIESGRKYLWPQETMGKLERDATRFRDQLDKLMGEVEQPKNKRSRYNPTTKTFEPIK